MKKIQKIIFKLFSRQKQNIQTGTEQINFNIASKNNKSLKKTKSNKLQSIFILEIDEIQQKTKKAKSIINNDLAQRFEGKTSIKKAIVLNKLSQNNEQLQKQSIQKIAFDQPYQFNKKKYTDVPKINQFMNAAISIQFDPQSIKYEYQENVQTLVQNVFSQQTEKNLRKKERSMAKSLLDGSKLQNELIENLLMLYGLRKQEQFQENLIDPLQKLLSQKKSTERRTFKYLADMINRINTRKAYYQQIVIYLPLQQLVTFSKTISLIQKIDIVSQIVKYRTLMQICEFILQNKEFQKALKNLNQSKDIKLDEKQLCLRHIVEIELWILKTLQSFLKSFQTEQSTKESIIAVCQNLSIYQNIKQNLQTLLKSRNLNKLLSETKQSFLSQQNKKDLMKLEWLIEHKQQEQFYEKISQTILFLDNKKQNKDQQMEIYTSIFKILLKFQDIKVADHIFQKVIDDHMTVFKKLTSFQTVSQSYMNLFTQFIMRNLDVSISEQYALALIKLIWLHNFQKNIDKEEMTFDQGKYFVISLHIISTYFKKLNKIDKSVIKYQMLIKTLRKYTIMINKERNQFYNLNKKYVLDLLQKALSHLFENNPQKDTVKNFIQQIKTITENQDS